MAPRARFELATLRLTAEAQQVSRELAAGLSAEMREVLEPLVRKIESLNERINEYDERMEKIAEESYPRVALLKQVKGVGTQIARTPTLHRAKIGHQRVRMEGWRQRKFG